MVNDNGDEVKVLKTISVLIVIVVMVMGWGVWIGTFGTRVITNTKKIEAIKFDTTTINKEQQLQREQTIKVQSTVEYILKDVKEIKELVKQ